MNVMLLMFIVILCFFVAVVISKLVFKHIVNRMLFVGAHAFARNRLSNSSNIIKISDNIKRLRHDRITVDLENGTLIDVYITDPYASSQILYFHGNVGTLDGVWIPAALDVHHATRSASVIMFDYRNFGNSQSADGQTTPENVVEDVHILVAFLRNYLGIDTFSTVIGRSIGAAVALQWLLQCKYTATDTLLLETPFLGSYSTRIPVVRCITEQFPVWFNLRVLCRKIHVVVLLAEDDLLIDSLKISNFCHQFGITCIEVVDAGHNNVHESNEWYDCLHTLHAEK